MSRAREIIEETRLAEGYGFVVTYDSPGGTKFYYKKQGQSGGAWTQNEDEAYNPPNRAEADQIVQGLSQTPGMADKLGVQTLGPGISGGPGHQPMSRTTSSPGRSF